MCILANDFVVVAKIVRAEYVTKSLTGVGLDPRWIPYLAVIEGTGVLGLVLGLFGFSFIGVAAAAGLTTDTPRGAPSRSFACHTKLGIRRWSRSQTRGGPRLSRQEQGKATR